MVSTHAVVYNGWGLAEGVQRSACLHRVNGRLNPGVIHSTAGSLINMPTVWSKKTVFSLSLSPSLNIVLKTILCIFACRGGHRGHGVHSCRGRQRGQHQRWRGGGPLQPPEQLQRHQLHSHTFPQTATAPLLGATAITHHPHSSASRAIPLLPPPDRVQTTGAAHRIHLVGPKRRHAPSLFPFLDLGFPGSPWG